MAKDKFTVEDIERELRRRSKEAKASLPKPGPKNEYPNSDRYGEDGRRIYSSYDAATVDRISGPKATMARRPGPEAWAKRVRLAAIVLAVVAAVLVVIVMSALPH
ncbi:MAG: hypothetical protein E5W55_01125 [Mesorhizobium sp.]|nr:MAG: hypothetical protein E5W55_01125 [Mesorhizobium sp.]